MEKMLSKEEMGRQVEKLNEDFKLYKSQVIEFGGEEEELTPQYYLEESLEHCDRIPYEVCVGFLIQFLEYDKVCEWISDKNFE